MAFHHEVKEAQETLKAENKLGMKAQERHKSHTHALETMGLTEAEAVNYVLMLSREDELAKGRIASIRVADIQTTGSAISEEASGSMAPMQEPGLAQVLGTAQSSTSGVYFSGASSPQGSTPSPTSSLSGLSSTHSKRASPSFGSVAIPDEKGKGKQPAAKGKGPPDDFSKGPKITKPQTIKVKSVGNQKGNTRTSPTYGEPRRLPAATTSGTVWSGSLPKSVSSTPPKTPSRQHPWYQSQPAAPSISSAYQEPESSDDELRFALELSRAEAESRKIHEQEDS